jgi:semaphorin 6
MSRLHFKADGQNRNSSYRFTQITVDPQVKTPGGKTYDVLFIGTDNGKVIKAINAESADSKDKVSPVVIEEIQAFPASVPVRGIKVVRATQPGDGLEDGRLVVIADSQVQALRLHRCYSERILSCGESSFCHVTCHLHLFIVTCK